MRDSEARSRIEEGTDRSILVEAAAGTGKTTLIIERVLRGIRDGALEMPQTVAITFTEKAAGELEERLRRRLSRCVYRDDLPATEGGRLRAALDELDQAHISTIHSFCARLLRERPAEAGVDPDFTVLEQAPAALLREEAWREWMEIQVAEAPWAFVEALRAGVRARQLQELAYALADAPEILEIPRFELPRPEGDLDETVRAVREAAPPAAQTVDELIKGSGNRDSRALRDAAQAIAESPPEEKSALRRVAYAAAGADLENALKSFRGDREAARPALERFSGAARRLGSHLAARVFQWTAGFVEHYRQLKRSRSVLDFQDLLLVAARVLRNNPEVRRYFQRRFRAFFVDEFQDTDPLQAELIGYLCEARSGSPADRLEDVCLEEGVLMAVGDPKQSIYRFRRADVQMYEQFKRLFGPERIERIYCNFRSVSPLLDWFNRLFEALFSAPEDEKVYQAEHVPLARGLAEQQRGGPGVVAVCPAADLSTEGWNAARARAWEAHHLARLVREAVEGESELPVAEPPLSYGSFAFLFRALTDVDIYEEALDARGIPYRVVGGKHFYRRSQTEETLCLLRAIDDPLDEPAIVGALRSSYFGVSDEELLRHRAGGGPWNYLRSGETEGPVGEALALMARWHHLRNRLPPPVLLGQVFDETRAQHAYMLKPAGEQRAAALEQLRRRLRSLGQSARTFGAVVRHLSSIEEADLPEEESSSVEPGDDFVQLLSMHKAKGLEFSVVVLPDLGRSFPHRGRVGRLLFDRHDGRVGLRLDGGIETPAYGDLQAEEHGNQMAELRRLFYVACTRAQQLLVLPL
ncbi:MAG: UvrD-helicase domain-containing protein, partial [Candidatus Brocadiaceae bacterium]